MKLKIINSDNEQPRIVAHLDGLQAKVNTLPAHALGRLQSATREELRPLFGPLRALMPSVLDRAFKGEL